MTYFFVNDLNDVIAYSEQEPNAAAANYMVVDDPQQADKLISLIGFVRLTDAMTLPPNWYESGLIAKRSLDLDAALGEKTKQLHTNADQLANPILRNYSAVEIATFDTQKEEWQAYQADAAASTPTLDGFATRRGITREVMMQKVEDAITAMKTLSGAIVAEQQAKEDELKAAYAIKDTFTNTTEQLAALENALAALDAVDINITV